MIEIIKHGNRPKTDKHVKFKCERCGCEWIADNAEYMSHIGGMGHEWVSCRCPECDYVDSQDVSEQEEKRPKTCYETSCVHYMFSNSCGLSFPPGTAFDGLTGSQCPYYTRREEPLPGAFSERD